MVLCGEDWTALVGSTLEIFRASSYQLSVHLANSARGATRLPEHTRCLPTVGYLAYAILYPTVFSQQRGEPSLTSFRSRSDLLSPQDLPRSHCYSSY